MWEGVQNNRERVFKLALLNIPVVADEVIKIGDISKRLYNSSCEI
jgi:hypothetical protein